MRRVVLESDQKVSKTKTSDLMNMTIQNCVLYGIFTVVIYHHLVLKCSKWKLFNKQTSTYKQLEVSEKEEEHNNQSTPEVSQNQTLIYFSSSDDILMIKTSNNQDFTSNIHFVNSNDFLLSYSKTNI